VLREWFHRLAGTFRWGRPDRDLEEELRAHMQLAADAAARRGSTGESGVERTSVRGVAVTQAMGTLRDRRGLPWLHAVASDVTFGWRQLTRRRTTTVVAILSLGLAMGATTAAFRLVDAVLLRPLPVADPDRLLSITFTVTDSQNRPDYRDDFDYPTYRRYRQILGDRADLMIVGMSAPQVIPADSGAEPQRVWRQYVSGNVFTTFGLRPAIGRLLVPADDEAPGAHPVVVLSHDYWTRRFGGSAQAIGQMLRLGGRPYEIVGVSPKGFTGTEPGRVVDVFVPATMNVEALNSPGWSWFRLWLRPRRGVAPAELQQLLQTAFLEEHHQRIKTLPSDYPQQQIDAYLKETILLVPAAAGASTVQKDFRRPLLILSALVALVLLIACTNVANLLIAQAMARGREMALRVSIGADRWRLIRLVLVESALLAIAAAAVGTLFGWWAAPMIVSMLAPPAESVRLVFAADWRAWAFALTLTLTVTCLFGLAPAIRASSFTPLSALKSGSIGRGQRRIMHALVAAQMGFCVFVLVVAALFVATFGRLVNQPLGFSHDHVLLIDAQVPGKSLATAAWSDIIDQLRQAPGVEAASGAGWAFLSDNRWSGMVLVPGRPPETRSPYFLEVFPRFFDTMRIRMIHGRDFQSGDRAPKIEEHDQPVAGVGIVNEAFARVYFDGQNPVGRRVTVRPRNNVPAPMEIVGLVGDAVYSSVREGMRPTVYVPLEARNNGTVIVRTEADPLAIAPALRQRLMTMRPDLRTRMATMSGLVRRQFIRERLLAALSLFFAGLALVLAAVGLYGVLTYTVVQHRREIGVRMALGARAPHVIRRVTSAMAIMVAAGLLAGLAGGLGFGRLIERLLFHVPAIDPVVLLGPTAILAATAVVAALPPLMRAVHTDPAQTLRNE
jgi:putative ABC transport system permease protein